MKTEPAVIVSLVSAVIALVVSFGINVSEQQIGAIMAVVSIAAGIFIRQNVYAPATVEKLMHPEVPPPPPGT